MLFDLSVSLSFYLLCKNRFVRKPTLSIVNPSKIVLTGRTVFSAEGKMVTIEVCVLVDGRMSTGKAFGSTGTVGIIRCACEVSRMGGVSNTYLVQPVEHDV